ncbi:MAG: TetR/AcrR family transcriptional regulator [Tannerella sp.]|jgi:AcrR family transcriptional regulator|nr:TetR/AcrR family transcriptional regulator [Tannerella sp.]
MSQTTSKTREILIDAARRVFARKGIERTTMNDIAVASQKGRRTLYMYFKNKEELSAIVIKNEMERLYEMLETVEKKNLPADEKLMTFIYMRLDAFKAAVTRNGTLRANFFHDSWNVAKVRKGYNLQEIALIKKILNNGIKEGIFNIPDIDTTTLIIHYSLKGMEVPYIRGLLGDTPERITQRKESVMNLIFNGIKTKNNVY